MRVPRNCRKGELKFLGESFGDLRPAPGKSGERAHGAAKLHNEIVRAKFGEPRAVAQYGVEPSGGNEAKGGGESLLHPGARNNGSCAMLAGKFRENGSH